MSLSSLPLPLKVLLSYLAVLAAGAIPALVYVEAGFDDRLLRHEAEARATQARQMAAALTAVPSSELRGVLMEAAPFCACRLSAILPTGEVLFDSAVPNSATLTDHSGRSEVRQVLGQQEPSGRFNPEIDGVGVARRVSKTTGREHLYVAVRVRAPDGPPWVLRVATDTAPALRLQTAAATYLRNALSVSVTVALLLTLVAAIAFVRPLRRLKATAEALADGDFTVNAKDSDGDEIGDVARALTRLGTELRRKMAAAGSVEAVALQLIEGIKTPVVLLTEEGKVLAINGGARRLFEIEGPSENEVMRKVAGRKRVRNAFDEAAESGLPVKVDAGLGSDETTWAHVIRRPADRPLWVLSAGVDAALVGELPAPEDIVAKPFVEMLELAVAELRDVLAEHEVKLSYEAKDVPIVEVADAGDRCGEAVERLLKAAIATADDADRSLLLAFERDDTRVGLRTLAVIDEDAQESFDDLLAPVGGELDAELGEATLWLPRA